MALPTIDLSTLLRIAISKALVSLKSPLALVIGFSAVIGVVGTALKEFFEVGVNIPKIELETLYLPELYGLKDFILYMANLDQIQIILNSIIGFFNLLVPFSLLFFGSFFVGIRLYNITVAGRETLKESVGGQK